MNKEKILVGIDAGSFQVKTLVVRLSPDKGKNVPAIIGTGLSVSHGVRRGHIEDISELSESIAASVALAEKTSGLHVSRAEIALGEAGLGGIASTGSVIVGRADAEITDLDSAKALEVAEQNLPVSLMRNKFILHRMAVASRVDNESIFGSPVGLKGGKLDVKHLFIAGMEQNVSKMAKAVEADDIEISNISAGPLAASLACLTKSQKMAGCLLANIGADTTSVVVYEDNVPVSLEILAIGGRDITHDIALGLKISIEEAEALKIGAMTQSSFSKKKLDDIINARLADIFEKVEAHLKKQGKSRILPAGVILTGGAAKTHGMETAAREHLKLPAKIAAISAGEKGKTLDPIFSTAYGLCMLAAKGESNGGFSTGKARNLLGWFKQFLP